MTKVRSRFSLVILLLIATPHANSGVYSGPIVGSTRGSATSGAATAKSPPSGTAAVVNGTSISISAVDQAAIRAAGAAQLSIMIDFVLIEQAATKAGVTVSDEAVNAEIAKMKAGLLPGQSFEDALKMHNVSLSSLENQIRHRLMLENLVQRKTAIPPMAHVREILIATAPTQRGTDLHEPHSDADALAIVEQIRAKLRAGKSFSDLVTEYSEDPLTRSQGGDLGVIWNGTDGFNNAVWPSIETLRVGQVTRAPVKTAVGYVLAQLVSTSADPLPSDKDMYSDRTARYRQNELNHDIKQLLDQLHAQATITRYAFN
jgi:foldase protein PrsA